MAAGDEKYSTAIDVSREKGMMNSQFSVRQKLSATASVAAAIRK